MAESNILWLRSQWLLLTHHRLWLPACGDDMGREIAREYNPGCLVRVASSCCMGSVLGSRPLASIAERVMGWGGRCPFVDRMLLAAAFCRQTRSEFSPSSCLPLEKSQKTQTQRTRNRGHREMSFLGQNKCHHFAKFDREKSP